MGSDIKKGKIIPHPKLHPHFFLPYHDYCRGCGDHDSGDHGFGDHGSDDVRCLADEVDADDDHPYPSVQIVHQSELVPRKFQMLISSDMRYTQGYC